METGKTRTYAKRVDLAAMVPRDDLAATKHCLANPGEEYFVYLPEGDEVTVNLSQAPGEYKVEPMHPVQGTIVLGGNVSGRIKA